MYSSFVLLASAFAHVSAALVSASNQSTYSDVAIANGTAQAQIAAQAYENAWNALPDNGTCSKQNVQIRKEFRSMSLDERKGFTDAIQCLQSMPSILDSTVYPGAKTRYDDFVVVHINQTLIVHNSVSFLTWHRLYIWALHTTLIQQCNYTGQMPFWEWGIDAASDKPLNQSELFNGDAYSMGSDGTFLPNNTDKVFTTVENTTTLFEAGSGGGPVYSGPFTNYTVNLGPLAIPYLTAVNSTYAYNPRPLVRSLRRVMLQQQCSYNNYTPILLNSSTPFDLQTLLDGDYRNPANLYPVLNSNRVHGGGHFTFGGDPSDDFYVSPAEPLFWLHHGQIDRMYWLWQNMELDQMSYRTSSVPNLTRTFYDEPPSGLGTVDDPLDVGVLAPWITINESLSTTGGTPFCYLYQ